MRILLVDNTSSGHHRQYRDALRSLENESDEYSFFVVSPEDKDSLVSFAPNYDSLKKNQQNKVLMNAAIKGIDDCKPDVIHFLYGDNMYRSFGVDLPKAHKKARTIATFHNLRYSRLHELSMRRIFRHIDMGVVHTSYLKKQLHDMRIQNVVSIEYPSFMPANATKIEARQRCGIKGRYPVIACIGGIRFDKGLDLMLKACALTNDKFELLIAGKPIDFSRECIEDNISTLSQECVLRLGQLTDQEYTDAILSADIICCPYRRIFDGASGPMTDGVGQKKTIIASDHGSLSDIVKSNHLGLVFETENSKDLARALNEASSVPFIYDDYAEKYSEKLSVSHFKNRHRKLYKAMAGVRS